MIIVYRIHFTDPDYKSAVKEPERAVAYMRAAVTFAFETPTKRGLESFIGQMDMFFPSTYALPTDRYRLNEESLAVDLRVLADIGRKYSIKLHRLLEFWRRGFELGELWYYSESYLNYFKILELMAKQIKVGSDQKFILLRDRFNTPEYKKRYGLSELRAFTLLVLVFQGQASLYALRARDHFWTLKPSRILLTSTIAVGIILLLMAIFGIIIHPIGLSGLIIIIITALMSLIVADKVKKILPIYK